MSSIETCPRPEYPRPQFVRQDWMNLNGTWEFAVDKARNGLEQKFFEKEHLDEEILVPFCPESRLSGLARTEFLGAVWYRREVSLPESWKGGRVLLHFGAVDYLSMVWVNGLLVGTHAGGYTPFAYDITPYVKDGKNTICVYAEDDVRSGRQPGGKQSARLESYGCFYTRTTGIWQTVWLEHVPDLYITEARYTTNIDQPSVTVAMTLNRPGYGAVLHLSAKFAGKEMGSLSTPVTGRSTTVTLPLLEKYLWDVGQGNLYDLELTVVNGEASDHVQSYFGLRSIDWDAEALWLNGRKVFQRLVLDQGFYPDGIYTAPDAEAIKNDIDLSMAFGFNGARAHQKVFEPIYQYYADQAGYLLWGEYASWGLDISRPEALEAFLPEWLEAVKRDYNSPSVVGWCPFNETWDYEGRAQDNAVIRNVYLATKAVDLTRPVIDTSGNYHVETDIFDNHWYEQDPKKFAAGYEDMKHGGAVRNEFPDRQAYHGEPYMVSEYGGIRWNGTDFGWGYGEAPKTEEEFIARYDALTTALLENPRMVGFCYTQLTDVEQEVNGLCTYERRPKFDPERIRKINQKKAAIED